MKYLQIILITCALVFQVNINVKAQEQKKARLYTGYQFAGVDYIQIGIDSRYLFAEGRLSVNNYIAHQHDAEIAAGVNFCQLLLN